MRAVQICSLEAYSPDRTAKLAFFVVVGFVRFESESMFLQPPAWALIGVYPLMGTILAIAGVLVNFPDSMERITNDNLIC